MTLASRLTRAALITRITIMKVNITIIKERILAL
jgi:hypothetical protein